MPFFSPFFWNDYVMHGGLAAILDHANEDHILAMLK